jgi:hypothetical protein
MFSFHSTCFLSRRRRRCLSLSSMVSVSFGAACGRLECFSYRADCLAYFILLVRLPSHPPNRTSGGRFNSGTESQASLRARIQGARGLFSRAKQCIVFSFLFFPLFRWSCLASKLRFAGDLGWGATERGLPRAGVSQACVVIWTGCSLRPSCLWPLSPPFTAP